MNAKQIGARIAQARKATGRSQSELGRLLGISAQAVQKWENGDSSPRGARMARLGELLGISPEWILFGDKPDEAPPVTLAPADTAITPVTLLSPFHQRLFALCSDPKVIASLSEIQAADLFVQLSRMLPAHTDAIPLPVTTAQFAPLPDKENG